jgi:hypothetical protein
VVLPTARLIILAAASLGKLLREDVVGVSEKNIVLGSVFGENKGNDAADEDLEEGVRVSVLFAFVCPLLDAAVS